MKSTAATSVLLLSLLIFITLTLVIGASFLKSGAFLSTLPRAETIDNVTENTYSLPLCPLNLSVYVNELLGNGKEAALVIDDEDADVSLWGLSDTRHMVSGSGRAAIAFNRGQLARYAMYASELAFVPFPEADEVYPEGAATNLKLYYDSSQYDVVKKEIKLCTTRETGQWLCEADTNGNLDIISGIKLGCNMDLDLGWVVKKRRIAVQNDATIMNTVPAKFKTCDLNDDSACNTIDLLIVIESYGRRGNNIEGDINNDSRVDALDYTLVIDQL